MKKNTILIFFSLIFLHTFGQTYEERIASKTCDCIALSAPQTNANTNFKHCILQSKYEVENKDLIKNTDSSIEGMRKAFQIISDLVNNNCLALKTNKATYQKTLFYKDSENKEASFNLNKGNKFLKAKEYVLALKAYKKAIRLDEKFVYAYDQLAATYFNMEEYTKAIKYYKKSLKLFPQGDVALQNLADIYYLKNDPKKASEYLTKLITIYPESPEAHLEYSKNILKDNQLALALQHSILALNYFKKTETQKIDAAQNLIRSIYNTMEVNNQLALFHTISKENNFDYKTIK